MEGHFEVKSETWELHQRFQRGVQILETNLGRFENKNEQKLISLIRLMQEEEKEKTRLSEWSEQQA